MKGGTNGGKNGGRKDNELLLHLVLHCAKSEICLFLKLPIV